jgi:hypothetical protein
VIRRLSLRWRVAAAFGVGLALVMTVLAVATWNLTTGYMLDQHEQSATRQSEVNVRLVDAALADDSEGLEELLTGLATGPDSSILLSRPAGWLTSGRQIDRAAPAVQRSPAAALVVAGPLSRRSVVDRERPAAADRGPHRLHGLRPRRRVARAPDVAGSAGRAGHQVRRHS